LKHNAKNGCVEQDEVFNPYTKQWECMHCGETLSSPIENNPVEEQKGATE